MALPNCGRAHQPLIGRGQHYNFRRPCIKPYGHRMLMALLVARMLAGGEDPLYFATSDPFCAEDIGLAEPEAQPRASMAAYGGFSPGRSRHCRIGYLSVHQNQMPPQAFKLQKAAAKPALPASTYFKRANQIDETAWLARLCV